MQFHHTARAPRGQHRHQTGRLSQPSSTRNVRKVAQPDPETLVTMPDGQQLSAAEFHVFRSTSHMKLNGTLDGCARRIRDSIPRAEWAVIDTWMKQYRSRYKEHDRSSDNLMAVLLDFAGSRMKNRCEPSTVLTLIMQDETAKVLLPKPKPAAR